MTTTETFDFTRNGTTYSGSPRWDVRAPAGQFIGYVAKSEGKRGSTWLARTPMGTTGGFRNREAAARYLEEKAR